MASELHLIKKKYQTDKNEHYLSNYEDYFSHLKDDNISLLEIGIFKGGSLLMWRDYFNNGAIVGLDVNEVKIEDDSRRISTYKGFQQNTALLSELANEAAPNGFDIIIDDGSHIGELTAITFWHLFENHLKPGGIYVIEDWRTGFWGGWPDGKQYNLKNGNVLKRGKLSSLLDRKLTEYLDQNSSKEMLNRLKNSIVYRLRMLLMKKRIKSHDYGMVGFIKQLVDEMGTDAFTSEHRGSPVEKRGGRFEEVSVKRGQVFVVKNDLH